MSLLDDLVGEGEIPEKITVIVDELQGIKVLLDKFEKSSDQKYMKEAAAKIKNNAPLIKALGADKEFSGDEFNKKLFKRCRDEMKALFDRAKKLKADAEEKKLDTSNNAPITSSPSVQGESSQETSSSDGTTSTNTPTPQSQPDKIAAAQSRMEQRRANLKNKQSNEQSDSMMEDEKISSGDKLSKTAGRNMKKGNDIWSKLLQERNEKGEDKNNINEDYTLVVLGEKNSGKSTLINRIQEKSEAVAPSGAMEYSYARRTKKYSTNQARDVIHTWEVASSSSVSEVMDVTLTGQTIENTAIVIVLDLSKPGGLLDDLIKWLDIIRKRVDECIKELRSKNDSAAETLKKKANYSVDDHPDKNNSKPIGVPVILVGTKYDIYQDMDSVLRKIISKSLRFVAQTNCCSLVFVSKEEESQISKFRGLLNYFTFQNTKPIRSGGVTDYTKPLVIPSGSDTLESIGAPPFEINNSSSQLGMRVWKDGWNQTFPITEKEKLDDTFIEDSLKFNETVVDAVRVEKEKLLERYKKESTFRAREKNFGSSTASPSAQYERALNKNRP